MNLPEILLLAYAAHILFVAVLFALTGSTRLSDAELNRLTVALLWPLTGPMLLGLWLWTRWRAVRLPRATLRVKGKRRSEQLASSAASRRMGSSGRG